MKLMLSLLFMPILLVVFSSEAKQKSKKVEVKCHVELYGGGETIYFRKIKKEKLAKLEKKLVNRKIKVAKTKGKQQIYKVFECTLLENNFATSQSKTVDKSAAR